MDSVNIEFKQKHNIYSLLATIKWKVHNIRGALIKICIAINKI